MYATCVSATLFAVYIGYQTLVSNPKTQPSKRRYSRTRAAPFERIPLDRLPKLRNDLVLRAALNQPTPRVPVWCMRQAGRHLPEFRQLRQDGYDFFTMCQVPELAVEVSLQPLRRYDVDAVIIFSDILVVPQAMGMTVEMIPGSGPHFPHPLKSPEKLKSRKCIRPLSEPVDVDQTLGYVLDALNLARQKIGGKVPLIGFCGGPLTLMTYMCEGGSSRTKSVLKTWLYTWPEASHTLLQAITDVCVDFLIAQRQAGAQALQVFESVGAETLTQDHFYTFCFPYLAQVAKRVKDACPDTPLIGFSKGTPYAVVRLARDTAFDCLGLDWQTDVEGVRRDIGGSSVALQGNFDTCALYASQDTIREETRKMLRRFGTQGYIANLGHGCHPDLDPANVMTFVRAVQEMSREMNN